MCFSAVFPRSSHPHGVRGKNGRVNTVELRQKLIALLTNPRSSVFYLCIPGQVMPPSLSFYIYNMALSLLLHRVVKIS